MAEEGDTANAAAAGAAVETRDGDDGRIREWEVGLPSADDLTPLSQSLISPELAFAFSLSPQPARTILDVHRASHHTVSGLRRSSSAPNPFPFFTAAAERDLLGPDDGVADPMALERGHLGAGNVGAVEAEEEEAESSAGLRPENSAAGDEQSSRKRPRLVWTPQLHKRFVDAIAHLGMKNAMPKTIMQLMNVEGLSRENVASHLQKYRLYRKRMEGFPTDGPSSSSDHAFGSAAASWGRQEPHMSMPMPVGAPQIMPAPVFRMAQHPGHNGHMGMMPMYNHGGSGAYHGFDSHQFSGVSGDRQGG